MFNPLCCSCAVVSVCILVLDSIKAYVSAQWEFSLWKFGPYSIFRFMFQPLDYVFHIGFSLQPRLTLHVFRLSAEPVKRASFVQQTLGWHLTEDSRFVTVQTQDFGWCLMKVVAPSSQGPCWMTCQGSVCSSQESDEQFRVVQCGSVIFQHLSGSTRQAMPLKLVEWLVIKLRSRESHIQMDV